jgi:AcrR family transcriptional regulator
VWLFEIDQKHVDCSEVWKFGNREEDVAKKPDRRVERSQQLLRSALVSLIQEKGFEALTVQEIIDRANVGRATFYAHFDNKEDLLISGFDELRASLQARQREALARVSAGDERLLAFSYEVFAHVNEYREVSRAMVGRQSGAAVQRVLHKLLVDLVRDDVKAAVRRGADSRMPREALAQFIAGALFGLLMWWLEEKRPLSPNAMNDIFRRLAIPAIAAVRER